MLELRQKSFEFTKGKAFFLVCLFFIFGIGAASYWALFSNIKEIWLFTAGISFLLISILISDQFRFIFLLFAFFIFGIWRYQILLPDGQMNISDYNTKSVEFIAQIISEPDIRLNNIKYTVKVKEIMPEEIQSTGRVLITADPFPLYNYGDTIKVQCRLQAPEEFNGFAYDRYLAKSKIYSVCYRPEIKLLAYSSGNRLYRAILKLKNNFRDKINLGLTEPHAGFARALMFGDRSALPEELNLNFTRTGLTHIVAISGMNISILSVLCMNFLISAGLYRKQAFYFSVLFLLIFLIMIGLPASAVRAGIMGIMVLTAQQYGRLSRAKNSIVFTGMLMLFINPAILRDDIGFQLSFLSVFGLVVLYPLLKNWCEQINMPSLLGMTDAFLVTISAIIFTLPIIAYDFSTISLIAPLANILVVWAMAPVMILIIFAILFAYIMPGLAPVLFFPSYLLLEYIIRTAAYFGNLPFSSLNIEYVNFGWILGYYFFLTFVLKRFFSKFRMRI